MFKKRNLKLNWRVLNVAVVFSMLLLTINPALAVPLPDGQPAEPAISPGEIVINEIMYAPAIVSDSAGEWFELYNTTDREINLNDCFLGDNSGTPHQLGGLIMGAYGYALAMRNDDQSINGGILNGVDYGGVVLNNNQDSIVIKCGETIIDRVDYYISAGWPEAEGASIILADPSLDNNDPANWCVSSSQFGDGDLGTPGAANDSCGDSPPQQPACTDNDQDGYSIEGGECGPIDCNDEGALVNPGALEICNQIDDNCDGQIDEGDACPIGPVCGNNQQEDGEQCDDGNNDGGDGCSSLCQLELDIPCAQLAEATGWYGRYFNYSNEHPDMNLPSGNWPDKTHGDPLGAWTADWYDSQYFKFARVDGDISFGDNFFPFDMAVAELDSGHEFHFGVHWRGVVEIATAGDYAYYVASDDDSWVYIDGNLTTDLSGIHSKQLTNGAVYLSAGKHIIDIYFAERHTVQSSFQFGWLSEDIVVRPFAPDCQLYAYCGDGQINQDWEQCDDGDNCTEYCLLPEQQQCSDLVLAKININEFVNWYDGDMSSNIYLGGLSNIIPSGTWFPLYWQGSYFVDPDIGGYEVVPGLAVERLSGQLRLVMHASHQLGSLSKEHSHGWLELYNGQVIGLASDNSNGYGKANNLERGFDGVGVGSYNAGNDEVWSESSTTANFWLTADTGDDGFYADWQIIEDCNGADICGYKWYDDDQDSQRGELEKGILDWLIKLIRFSPCDEGEQWADSVVDYSPGFKNNDDPLDSERTNAANALGQAERDDSLNFVSLGFGGSLILAFDNIIYNGSGDDLEVVETSYGNPACQAYPETIAVYASQSGEDGSWHYLGSGCLDSTFDLGDLGWAKYLKLTDETDPEDFTGVVDGFDIDGIRAINCAAGYQLVDSAKTDDCGGYCFDNLDEGHYQVEEDLPAGWVNTTPLFYNFNVQDGDSLVANFGNYLVCTDNDQDGYSIEGGDCGPIDCNDESALVNPGALEICNEIDDNCNGETDEGDVCQEQPYCGDGSCNGEETCSACPTDCGACPNGGGGFSAGGFSGLYIHTENKQPEPTAVTITWFTNKPADSRVVYDTVSHSLLGGDPNYGYQWSSPIYDDTDKVTYHSVLIEGLTPDTHYYFRPISADSSDQAKGIELAYVTARGQQQEQSTSSAPTVPPEDQQPSTAGTSASEIASGGSVGPSGQQLANEADDISPTEEQSGEVAGGEETNGGAVAGVSETCSPWPWWLIIALLAAYIALLIINYFSKSITEETNDQQKKTNKIKDNLVWPFIIILAAMPILSAVFCASWSWWLWLMVVIAYFVILRFYYQGIATKNYWLVSILLTLFLVMMLAVVRGCLC